MQAARLMNNSDWTGEMNNMLAASRELVFDDRNTYKTVLRTYPDLQPLAKHFLDESRASAQMTIAQRDRLAEVTMGNLITFETASSKHADQQQYALPGLPLVKTNLPQIVDFQLGYMKGIDSNVQSPDGNLSLLNYDQSQTYVNNSTHLYYGNVTLGLPDADADLRFKICPLAPPVRGTIAPARLASGNAFQRTFDLVKDRQTNPGLCDQLSTAAKLNVVINLKGADGQVTQPMVITVTAASNGGCPRP